MVQINPIDQGKLLAQVLMFPKDSLGFRLTWGWGDRERLVIRHQG
jgi:hypothetical protein